MSKIILQGHILVLDSELDMVGQALEIHKKLTLQETGCLVFEVTQALDNVNKFHVYEEFINQQAFDAHQCRVKNSNWGEVTINVERHYQITSN